MQVYDIGEADGLPFYAMEYLDGHDVREIMRALQARREKLPLEHAIIIAIGVAAALHYAHEMKDEEGRTLGIVHRDVSPQNVAVTFDGGVKLFDFGVAKASAALDRDAPRHAQGQDPVHVARAVSRRRGRSPQRRVLRRRSCCGS